MRQRTLVVVTADHGEERYEHGQTQHILQLYDEVARVLLALEGPRRFQRDAVLRSR